MMNDTTNLPVTMHEEPATTPEVPVKNYAVFTQLLDLLNAHIQAQVEVRFAHLVANTKALSLMDEGLKEDITVMIEEALDAHIRHYLNHADHGFVTEERVVDIVREALDEDLDDAVENMLTNKLENATLSISL